VLHVDVEHALQQPRPADAVRPRLDRFSSQGSGSGWSRVGSTTRGSQSSGAPAARTHPAAWSGWPAARSGWGGYRARARCSRPS
jgi:hypothetical protein